MSTKSKSGKELAMVQVNIPKDIFEKIRKKCEDDGFPMTTYWRKWIVEGYKAESKSW